MAVDRSTVAPLMLRIRRLSPRMRPTARTTDRTTTVARLRLGPTPADAVGVRRSRMGRSSDREAGVDRGEEGGHHGRADDRRAVRCGRGFLRGLAGQFGVDDTETAIERVDEETVEIRLTGGDLGLLIGPKGQTLQLIQELARTTVQRRGGGTQEGRIRIDIAGYRQRRSEALARFTEQVAADVVAAGSPKALEPMNPADRKVVHDTANGIEGVRTVSEGERARRRVVILPAE